MLRGKFFGSGIWVIRAFTNAAAVKNRAHENLFGALDFLGGLGIQPFVVVLLAFNGEKSAGHSGVAAAAELRAVDLVAADLCRREPARNPQAGNRILADAHRD